LIEKRFQHVGLFKLCRKGVDGYEEREKPEDSSRPSSPTRNKSPSTIMRRVSQDKRSKRKGRVEDMSHVEKSRKQGIYVVLKGNCRVITPDSQALATLNRGEFFGENLILKSKTMSNFGII